MRIDFDTIGTVIDGRREPIDDHWGPVEATIELDGPGITGDATRGLEDFSHVDVVFVFHLVEPDDVTVGARHPRGRADWPEVGILAQRARNRPNRIGVTTCELLAVSPRTLRVRGLDALAGSPVLDVKPYFAEFGPRDPVREPAWAEALMRDYW
jgi:tRNA-Thr(GGU) m(6)t(6)A37 methyltransferase TsaA